MLVSCWRSGSMVMVMPLARLPAAIAAAEVDQLLERLVFREPVGHPPRAAAAKDDDLGAEFRQPRRTPSSRAPSAARDRCRARSP